MIVQEVTTKATRLSVLIKAIHRRTGATWRSLGRDLGVSDFAVGKWRDGESSPERKHLDKIASHPEVNWTPQQLDLYLEGKFDNRDIDDLLDNGIPEGMLPVEAVKQAIKQYSQADRLEILSYLADLLKSTNGGENEGSDQKKINGSAVEIKKTEEINQSPDPTPPDNGRNNGGAKMNIKLSRLADIRLRPLLKKSLEVQGFGSDFLRAAQSVIEPNRAARFAKVLEHLTSFKFDPRLGYSRLFLEALAALCCQVERWVSDAEVEIDPTRTYRGDVERLLEDLEKTINGCPSETIR